MLPDDLAVELDLDAFAAPPVFSWLAATGGVSEAEMLRTFNCGFGMVAFVAAQSGRRDDARASPPTAWRRRRSAGSIAREGERVVMRGAAETVTARARIAILISGRGSNMAALIEAARAPDFPAEIALVLSNKRDAGGLELARAGGNRHGGRRSRRSMPAARRSRRRCSNG